VTFLHIHATSCTVTANDSHDCPAIYDSSHYNAIVDPVKKTENYQVCESWLFLTDLRVGTGQKILSNLIVLSFPADGTNISFKLTCFLVVYRSVSRTEFLRGMSGVPRDENA
jgi:hypothetical protein